VSESEAGLWLASTDSEDWSIPLREASQSCCSIPSFLNSNKSRSTRRKQNEQRSSYTKHSFTSKQYKLNIWAHNYTILSLNFPYLPPQPNNNITDITDILLNQFLNCGWLVMLQIQIRKQNKIGSTWPVWPQLNSHDQLRHKQNTTEHGFDKASTIWHPYMQEISFLFTTYH